MDFKKSRILMWIGFAVGIMIMVIGTGFKDERIMGGFFAAGTVLFFVALVQAFIFYNCPHCGKSLMDVRGDIPDYCPGCGKELNEERKDYENE